MKLLELIKDYALITFGIFIAAAGVYFFLVPSGLAIGSVSGLALVLSNFIPLTISAITMILNVGLLLIGFIFIGREFGVKTVYTSLMLPVFLGLFEVIFPGMGSMTEDAFIDMLCYLFVVSVGQAILFQRNASSGGLDIVAKFLNKYLHMELGKAMALSGMCVALTAVFVYDMKTVVLSVLGTYLSGLVLDHFIFGANVKKRVCIISENLAVGNGLSVGDTIPMQTYGYDPNIEIVQREIALGTRFPSAAIYSDVTGFTSQMEEYTIVGIYRQNNAWENQDDVYGLTPNVIFVPKGSISGDFRLGNQGVFYTLVLHNGKMKEFQKLQTQAGYPDLFICMDGGYTEIASGLDTYEGVAAKALYIGAGGSAVILLLFLVLCPLQQRKNLFLMGSLGTSPGGKIRHIFVSTMALMVPGVVLGVLTGALLWKQVATVLMGTMHVQIPMEANMAVLAPCLAAGLVAAMAVLVLTLAAAMSGSKGMMNRKG